MIAYSKFLFPNVFSNLERQTVRNSIVYYFVKLSYKSNFEIYSDYKYNDFNKETDIFKNILIDTTNKYFSKSILSEVFLDESTIIESFSSFKKEIMLDKKQNYAKYLLLLISKYSYFRYIDYAKYWNILNISNEQILNISKLYQEELNKLKNDPETYLSDIIIDLLPNVIYEDSLILTSFDKFNQLNRLPIDNKSVIIPDLVYSGNSFFRGKYKSSYINDNGDVIKSKLYIMGKESNPAFNKYISNVSIPNSINLPGYGYNKDFILIPSIYGSLEDDSEKNKIIFDKSFELNNKESLFKFVLSIGKANKNIYEYNILKFPDIDLEIVMKSDSNNIEMRNLVTNEKVSIGICVEYDNLKPLLLNFKNNKIRLYNYETLSWTDFISYTNDKINIIEFLNSTNSIGDKAFSLDIFIRNFSDNELLDIINNNYYSDYNMDSVAFSIEDEYFFKTNYKPEIYVNEEKGKDQTNENKQILSSNLNNSFINDYGYDKSKIFIGNNINSFYINLNSVVNSNKYTIRYKDYSLSNGQTYGINSIQYLFTLNGIFFKEYNKENLDNLSTLKFRSLSNNSEYILLNNLQENSDLIISIERLDSSNECLIKVFDKVTDQFSISSVNISWNSISKIILKDSNSLLSDAGYGKLFEIKVYSNSSQENVIYTKMNKSDNKQSLYREYSEENNYKKKDSLVNSDILFEISKESLRYLLEKDNILGILSKYRQNILNFIQEHRKIYKNDDNSIFNITNIKNCISNLYIGCNLIKDKSDFLLTNDFEEAIHDYIQGNYIKTILSFYIDSNGDKLDLNDPEVMKQISFMFLSDIITKHYFDLLGANNSFNSIIFNRRELDQIYLRFDKSLIDEPNHFFEILRNFKNIMLYGKQDIQSARINNIFILDKIRDFSYEYMDLNLYLYLLGTLEEDDPIIDDSFDKNNLIRFEFKNIETIKTKINEICSYNIIDDLEISENIDVWDYKNLNENLKNSLKIRRKIRLKEIIESMMLTFKQYRFVSNGITDFEKVQVLIYRNLQDYKNSFNQDKFNELKQNLNNFYDNLN